jgi:hypothetical protein
MAFQKKKPLIIQKYEKIEELNVTNLSLKKYGKK